MSSQVMVPVGPHTWIEALHSPCIHCGYVWHKHTLDCPMYRALNPERCAVKHSFFLRSSFPGRIAGRYGYECAYCNLIPELTNIEKTDYTHPFCDAGNHVWSSPCGCCTCCRGKEFCWCGAMRIIEGAR